MPRELVLLLFARCQILICTHSLSLRTYCNVIVFIAYNFIRHPPNYINQGTAYRATELDVLADEDTLHQKK